MRIGILTVLPHQFYSCMVGSDIFYQAFLNSMRSTLINFGFLIKEDFICGFNFRLYRLNCLHYFHSYTKF